MFGATRVSRGGRDAVGGAGVRRQEKLVLAEDPAGQVGEDQPGLDAGDPGSHRRDDRAARGVAPLPKALGQRVEHDPETVHVGPDPARPVHDGDPAAAVLAGSGHAGDRPDRLGHLVGERRSSATTARASPRLAPGRGILGSKVARIGSAFGMKVIAWSQNLTQERATEAGAEYVQKDDLFRRADIISIHSVLSPRTRGLVGARELALMKPTALLVNTSRGPIVEEAAIIAALKQRRIAGYGGDVFAVEPLPANHPLRSEPRALLTPHIGYVTEETYREFFGGMVGVMEAWFAGKPINAMT